jgi:SAM-dependent methyltransferase
MERIGRRSLVGLDRDPVETRQARSIDVYETVHTVFADRVPEPDASFDSVLSNSVLEHIPEIDSVLRELTRVLKPGGLAMITVPGVGFHRCLRGSLLPGLTRERYLQSIDRRLAHTCYRRTEQWRASLEAAGLRLRQMSTYLTIHEVRRWESVSRVTAGVLSVLFRNRQPIEVQRALGMRRSDSRMPALLARVLAAILSARLPDHGSDNDENSSGCILLIAERI